MCLCLKAVSGSSRFLAYGRVTGANKSCARAQLAVEDIAPRKLVRIAGGSDKFAEWICALQSFLHRPRDLPDALFDQRRRLADVSDGLAAIVEDAKIP